MFESTVAIPHATLCYAFGSLLSSPTMVVGSTMLCPLCRSDTGCGKSLPFHVLAHVEAPVLCSLVTRSGEGHETHSSSESSESSSSSSSSSSLAGAAFLAGFFFFFLFFGLELLGFARGRSRIFRISSSLICLSLFHFSILGFGGAAKRWRPFFVIAKAG